MDLKQNKTKRALALIAPIAIGFSLCACGGSEVAGGGPSGTEAGNAITAQILIANAPAANARVKLVEHNSLNGIEGGYTAIANDSGFVTIEKVPVGSYTMEATLNETALQLSVDVKDTTSEVKLGSQNLQKSVYIGGSIADFFADSISENFKNMNGFVKFRGLDHSATIKDGCLTWEQSIFHTSHIYTRELQSLCTMECHEHNVIVAFLVAVYICNKCYILQET